MKILLFCEKYNYVYDYEHVALIFFEFPIIRNHIRNKNLKSDNNLFKIAQKKSLNYFDKRRLYKNALTPICDHMYGCFCGKYYIDKIDDTHFKRACVTDFKKMQNNIFYVLPSHVLKFIVAVIALSFMPFSLHNLSLCAYVVSFILGDGYYFLEDIFLIKKYLSCY